MSIASKAANGTEAARESIHEAAAYGRRQASEAYDAVEGAARSAGRYAREHPGQALLIGLGGLLLASLLFRRR